MQCKPLLKRRARVYVRTDRREFTHDTTVAALRAAFPGRKIREIDRPFEKPTQTHLFGDRSKKTGEIDLVLT